MICPEEILALDASDPLAAKRNEFCLPEQTIYLDGNSLGPLPKGVKEAVADAVQNQWGQDLISSWNKHGWIDLATQVGEQIAPLVGASRGQVICCDSISINLFKLISSALQLNPERQIVLSQQDNFPTDLYMVQGLTSLLGAERCQLKSVTTEQLVDAIDESVAVLLLTHVNFRDGQRHDMQALTRLAHDKGVLVVWDLAHSAGAMPLSLDQHNVDFAVGCGYKYLNGGPGAPAFLYVAARHQRAIKQPLQGWMGHQTPFQFDPDYQAAEGVQQFLAGTPNILSLVALNAALAVFADVDMQHVRAKSIALAEVFIQQLSQSDCTNEFTICTPLDAPQRGSQIALAHPYAYAITQALIDRGIVADFRAPNLVRFGLTPLYTRYQDIWRTVQVLSEIMQTKRYLDKKYQTRQKVT
ncbi:kynureninase [Arenicella xantha]|uniref:Kynureninase n=1 Tax=Arenicella xantha TaxID=644221 RepID=A0A395JQ00_9GAMM|nr:kynureninase [Arenicella xantha]RBP51648.1 kynureninase [Arenicella xantha]